MANVVFLWHMHQPYYVDPTTRTAMMPWVRLHCAKGYLDMISIIEDYPRVRPNFNLTPVLLLQMRELIAGDITDLWLEWARKPAAELNETEKFALLENFFKVNWDNLVRPFPRFWELLNKRGLTFYGDDVRRGLRYFTTQEFLDLQVWFNLAWCGYTALRLYPELAALRVKDRGFTEAEKQRVLDIHLEIMALTLRKYADAEARGQVELTTTPFYHPILPLVYDTAFAERALPGRKFPKRFQWPEDAAAHLTLAIEQHAEIFGKKPRGLWPSEGSIAPELIPLMAESGIQYFCSDEENLFNSLRRDPAYKNAKIDHLELFQGWRVTCDGASVNAVFRERPLSDFIGFMAARNDPRKAADHLLHHMRHIAGLIPESGVIPLILDGENAWETFADGGEAFLRALYGGIEADSARLHSCTIEDYFANHPPARQTTTLHTGSWIGSNFDIWIGEEEENRAWELLGETRLFLEKKIESGALSTDQEKRALREIYAAEGSDWFWWYGPDFSTENDRLFDQLFRQHLTNVHTICGVAAPPTLERPICRADTTTLYTRPHQLIAPEIDGRLGSYFEWVGAGCYEPGGEQGTMHRGERVVRAIHFGFGEASLFIRVDPVKREPFDLELRFSDPPDVVVCGNPGANVSQTSRAGASSVKRRTIAAGAIIEWQIDFADLGVVAGNALSFRLAILRAGIEHECYPESAPIQLIVPDADFALRSWIV